MGTQGIRLMGFAPIVGEDYRKGFPVIKYSDSHDNREPRLIGIKRRVDNIDIVYDISGIDIEQVLVRELDLKEFSTNHSTRFNIDFILYP